MIALYALIALQAADLATTLVVLQRGGKELNPVARWFIVKLGPLFGLSLLKLAAIAVMVWAAPTPGVDYVFAALCGAYVFVVANNVRVLRRLTQ